LNRPFNGVVSGVAFGLSHNAYTQRCEVCLLKIYVRIKLDVQREALKGKWLPKIAAKNNSPPLRTLKVVILVYTSFFSQINWVKKKRLVQFGSIQQRAMFVGSY